MGLIIQKFGGTSVANINNIQNAATLVQQELAKNNQVIVVVSAMTGVTNQLVTLCNEISNLDSQSKLYEYDAAISSGEIVTAALFAVTLQERNIRARSIAAWQLPILTDNNSSNALVHSVDTQLLQECIESKVVPVITGFQGISKEGKITTLGRGGSDTTAALIAAAMKAERCDIYTDVEGVFSADPRVTSTARLLEYISFEEMLELASCGARVLHARCVEIAMRYNINLRVLSSFTATNGTVITSKSIDMENRIITGITSNKNLLHISINESVLSINQLSLLIAKQNICIEMMYGDSSQSTFHFIIALVDRGRAESLLVQLKSQNNITDFILKTNIAIVSIVGFGIKTDQNLLVQVLELLETNQVHIEMLQTTVIKISILVHEKFNEKTVSILHDLTEVMLVNASI